MLFYLFLVLLIIQRLFELRIARHNHRWIVSQGGYEVGKEHYKWLVLLHIFFICSLLIEYLYRSPSPPPWWWLPLWLFLLAQVGRYWTIRSLGSFWNTRILVLPHAHLDLKGPYRYIRHPNYLVVIIEILTFPLIFGLYITALLFSFLNLCMILYRISIEEKALAEATASYSMIMDKPRFMPWGRKW